MIDPSDLSKLDRQAKEELLRLMTIKEAKLKEKVLDQFELNAKQKEFHQSKARVRLFCGGNGSGKTLALVHELARTHLRKHNHREVDSIQRTWFWTLDLKKVDDYYDALKKVCPPSKLPHLDKMGTASVRRWTWYDGSTTTFFSYEQDPMIAEGTNLDAAFFDEPCPRACYIATYRGLRSNPNHFVCLGMTPISEPWIYTDIYRPGLDGSKPEIKVFLASSDDNKKNLSEDWFKDYFSGMTPEELAVRRHGEFSALQGRVFKEFNRRTHTVRRQAWPEEWPVYCSIDPHTRKPHTVLWIGVNPDDNLVVLNELSLAIPVDELARAILEVEQNNNYRIASRLIDNSGSSSDWSRDSAVKILQENGVRVTPVTNRQKTLEDGIHQIHVMLRPTKTNDGRQEPRLKVMSHCVGMLEDFELYSWADNRHPEKTGIRETPKKIHDDFIDPLRYVVVTKPRFNVSLAPIEAFGSNIGHKKKKDRS